MSCLKTVLVAFSVALLISLATGAPHGSANNGANQLAAATPIDHTRVLNSTALKDKSTHSRSRAGVFNALIVYVKQQVALKDE